ncbi:MAG: lysylphosphatidylglycerol synthase transmembrane domain-containing protein [Desulfobacterales bacterium]|jgi:uncharacterized protein (TIRG00374 family)
MKPKPAISLAIGAAVSAMALIWAFRHVPLQELQSYFQTMHYGWLLPAVATVLLSFVLRVLRWQLLLSTAWRIGFWHAFHPLMIGFMINCVLPGRVGELVRPAILYRKNQVPYPSGLATVAAERIFDTLTLLTLLAAVLIFAPIHTPAQVQFGEYQLSADLLRFSAQSVAALSAALVGLTILISTDRLRGILQRGILKIPLILRPWGEGWQSRARRWLAAPLAGILERIAEGLGAVKRPRKVLACLLLSFGNWLLLGLSYYWVALGAPGIELSFFDLLAVMIIICFFIALPSVPGYWGIWEAGGVFALALFGVGAQPAAGYTLANHAVQILPVMAVGVVSLLVTGAGFNTRIPESQSLASN